VDDRNDEVLDDRVHELEQRLAQLEEQQSALERSRSAMSGMLPPETRRHLKAAGREELLAVRSLLDRWIERMGDEGEAVEPSRENIPID
jgi:hypothetical protein